LKSKFNRNLLAGFFTIFFLTGAILSCSSGNGDDGAPPGGPSGGTPATIPAVVFIADKDTNGVDELYAALNDGASVVKLSGPMVAGQNVIDFKISPDGTRVAYRANQDDPNVIELYVNNINGGTPVKVSGPLAPNGNVEVLPALTFDAFGWSPDSSMIAYIADQNVGVGDVYELFVSTPDGLDNFQVSGALVAGGLVLEFEWAPNGSRIAYRATQDIAGVRELYTNLPSAISTAVKVSSPLAGASDVDGPLPTTDAFQWAPDSSLIAYLADATNDVFELYTANPDPGVAPDVTKVSGPLVAPVDPGSDVFTFQWAPDSSLVAYR
jgi:Tol biopolymer transport system component